MLYIFRPLLRFRLLYSIYQAALYLLCGLAALFWLPAASFAADLEIRTLSPGGGIAVEQGMRAKVHYQGRLSDGTVFDDSRERGTPFTFTLGAGEIIEGWDKGILGMEVGEKRQLVIPPELGYGLRGAGNIIPPGATLTFDIELIAIRWPPTLSAIGPEALAKARDENQVIIDIRNKDARAKTGVIEGAEMLTAFGSSGQLHPQFQRKFAELIKALETPFILYDEDGEAAAYLGNAMVKQLGFENVSYLEDGIYGWQKSGRPLVPYQP